VSPELVAAIIAACGLAVGYVGSRMELSTLPPKPEPTEGTDDGAEALPAADL
jgi:hypothetical protein